jgi:putative phosphoesterase
MKVGVISDTHDYLDPKVPHLFAGVDHILHAGDVGRPQILRSLEKIAPVTAVAGNTDESAWNYPLTRAVELAGRKFLLHHIVNPHAPSDVLRDALHRERPGVVIFGHTHKPFSETLGGILYFNPGYAGKSRFGMPRTLALLHCEHEEIKAEYLSL